LHFFLCCILCIVTSRVCVSSRHVNRRRCFWRLEVVLAEHLSSSIRRVSRLLSDEKLDAVLRSETPFSKMFDIHVAFEAAEERNVGRSRLAYLRTYPVQAAKIDGCRRSFRTPGTSGAARCVHLAAFSHRVLIYVAGKRGRTGMAKGDRCSGGSGRRKKENNKKVKGGRWWWSK